MRTVVLIRKRSERKPKPCGSSACAASKSLAVRIADAVAAVHQVAGEGRIVERHREQRLRRGIDVDLAPARQRRRQRAEPGELVRLDADPLGQLLEAAQRAVEREARGDPLDEVVRQVRGLAEGLEKFLRGLGAAARLLGPVGCGGGIRLAARFGSGGLLRSEGRVGSADPSVPSVASVAPPSSVAPVASVAARPARSPWRPRPSVLRLKRPCASSMRKAKLPPGIAIGSCAILAHASAALSVAGATIMSRRSAAIADCSPPRISASPCPASLKLWLRAIERSASVSMA